MSADIKALEERLRNSRSGEYPVHILCDKAADALTSAMVALEAQSSIVTAHVENGGEGRDSSVMRGWLERIAEERRLREAAEARLEELTRERDEAFKEAARHASSLLAANAIIARDASLLTAAEARLEEARAVLGRIERWFGEFPATNEFWDREKKQPMSYAACFGSNGERDFMRGLARAFLHQGGSDAR